MIRTDDFGYSELLIGGLEHFLFFNILGIMNVIIPTDEVIFFRGVG
jgi:hypothetical protein